jgi:hypothetical protein
MTRRTAAATALVSAAGLLVSLVVLVSWSGRQVDPPAPMEAGVVELPRPPAAGPDEPRRDVAAAREAAPGPAARRVPAARASLSRLESRRAARPVQVTIPSAQLGLPVRPVGVAPDGQMQLPPDPAVMGWYRFGPAPAGPTGGSVVLAGHLDSFEFGLGPLVRLREVEPGSSVTVVTVDGVRHDYTVRRVQRFDRQQLPGELFGRTGPELLRLITCGGAYDPDTGYEQNLVVTAAPVP